MAKTKISEFSSTPANNTDIDSINISEGCAPSGINDAIRELMAQLKDFQTGAQGDSFNGPIGTSTAAAGAFTTLSATGAITSTLATGTAPLVIASTTKVANLNVDLLDGADWASPAALGSTTPAAVSATTLSASSTVTLSGGTANGVAYLNGSKVVTSGSALTFDGTRLTSTTGKFGGGAASNSASLMVNNATNTATGIQLFQDGIESWIMGMPANSAGLAWSASGSEQMRLTSTGLGIGTSSPAYKLDVVGATGTTTSGVYETSASGSSIVISRLRTTGTGRGYWDIRTGNTASGLTGALDFFDNIAGASRLNLDSSGNLGLGVTPSAWNSAYKAFEMGSGSVVYPATSSNLQIVQNAYNNSSGSWLYKTTGYSSLLSVSDGGFKVFTGGTGTAGNAITFTQAMTLDASGRLGIGTTSPGAQLTVIGSAAKLYVDLSGDNYYDAANHVFRSFAGTERARIDSSGNLLVGTTSSAGKLTVVGGTTSLSLNGAGTQTVLKLNNDDTTVGTNAVKLGFTSSNVVKSSINVAVYNNDYMAFNVGSDTERMRIDSSGNLLVGKTATTISTVGAVQYPDGTNAYSIAGTTNSTTTLQVYSTGASANRFYVGLGGTVYATSTTITAISDQRLKENIRDLDDGLSAVMALKPRKFDWKEGKGANIKDARGFIAQEFETVFPDMIEEWRDPAPEGEEAYKAINANLIPTLVKAIQELKAEFDAYKASHP